METVQNAILENSTQEKFDRMMGAIKARAMEALRGPLPDNATPQPNDSISQQAADDVMKRLIESGQIGDSVVY